MKILTLDIETSPNLADVWSLWQQNVSLAQLRQSSRVLCWAAKWHSKPKVFFGAEWKSPDFIAEIYELIEEADAIVSYNGDKFDIPTLNKEFLLQYLFPTAPFQSIDIYKTVKRQFRFPSYKLDYVSQQLELGEKMKHEGHTLWTRVLAGEAKAQRQMERYCKQDVLLTEKLYDRLLPWISNHPNRNLNYAGGGTESQGGNCPKCASGSLVRRGFYYGPTGKYQTYRCSVCGGYSRDTRRSDGTTIRSS